jgi:hypothetical protein
MVARIETLASAVLKATPQTKAMAATLSQTVLPYLVFDTTASTPAKTEANSTLNNKTRDVSRTNEVRSCDGRRCGAHGQRYVEIYR